ncbi:MAG: type II toxin-antitoxin system RelE/ParE family toxin [Candidatus Lokiarchaeota archaeon]|nr:type II toxin-antitoxin system RelE/ParE family toxin [Candidatus Lokiarchaeota archaeon]
MAKIEWSSLAESDLNEIIDYIAQDSLEYPFPFLTKFAKKYKI